MNFKKVFILSLTLIIIVSLVGCTRKPDIVKYGSCTHEKFPGKCKIISIQKTKESINQINIHGGPGYEGLDIQFKFIPSLFVDTSDITSKVWGKPLVSKEFGLQLDNSWYIGPEFIKKYNIKENSLFDCRMSLLTEGSCSPLEFEFDKIDTADFFECSTCPERVRNK